jgi:hypothetical protein
VEEAFATQQVRAAVPYARIKAIAFDGLAVFDVRPVAALAEKVLPRRGDEMSSLWRPRQFEYTWLRTVGRPTNRKNRQASKQNQYLHDEQKDHISSTKERSMFLINSSYIAELSQVEPHRKEHVEWVTKHINEGIFLFAGPKKSKLGGIILAKSIEKERLLGILSEDSL